MGGHPFAAAFWVLLVPMAPPSAEPIDIVAVDTSALPMVAVDIVAPVRFTAEPVTAEAVDIDGAPVESVTPIDPDDVVVGLVIDDRPDVHPAAVTSSQGAAVELVRNSRDGIEVSLGTPSGLRTALTSDREANIARIAGITAGSPAVVRLPDVITDTIAELAASKATDRHAVVVLGGAVDAADSALAGISDALTGSGTVLHVVAPATADAGALRRMAERSGGQVSTSPGVLSAVDEVTSSISNRYRVVATVSGSGPHRVGLTLDGQQFGADFEVPAATGPIASVSATSDKAGAGSADAGIGAGLDAGHGRRTSGFTTATRRRPALRKRWPADEVDHARRARPRRRGARRGRRRDPRPASQGRRRRRGAVRDQEAGRRGQARRSRYRSQRPRRAQDRSEAGDETRSR